MKTKILLSLLIILTMSYSVMAQSNFQDGCTACELFVISALPQLLAGKNITFTDTMQLRMKAMEDGIILDNGKIVNKQEIANRVFKELGQPELALHFGAKPPKKATLVGYILEMSNNNEKHYVLTRLDKKLLYNPCNVTGKVVSTQEVFVYAK